jgi:hypothetical protein
MRLLGLVSAFPILLAMGCSSVQPIADVQLPSIPSSECNVTVYATEAQARKLGEIEQVCIIEGTSSGSFVHTPDTAIAKHKGKACECGVENVFIQSRQPMGMDVASVSMVAFRYVHTPRDSTDPEVFRKAKLCQERGGVWVNDGCQIKIP